MIAALVVLLLQNPPPAPVVRVWLGSPSPLARGAAVRVYVEARADGNLVVLHRRTDGRIEVLFPENPDTDPFVRAGTYEIRGREEQAAWVVAEPDGTGMVLAALSPDPVRFDEFVRAAAWDSEALVPTWSGADAAGSMSDIVQRMLGDGYFNYDLVTYRVAPPVYAQQDMTPQEPAPAYDAYPTCLDCTFIGDQLVIYGPVLGRRHFRRERPPEPQRPTSALALALGPRSIVAPQPASPASRFAPSHHTPGPVPIEPRPRAADPRTHVRYTRLSTPPPERSLAGIALPAGIGRAFEAGGGGLAPARPDLPGRAVTRPAVAVRERGREPPAAASQAAVRSRPVAVARSGEGAAQGPTQGVAIPREAWGGTRARAGVARGGLGVRQR